ncbi:MAG TPA: tetratricopeptide repeat protein [Acetobacteraceae bacterium]|jgi:tetratricopeptide (TPR) repeat protein|nr:tetratricopeptide repeat protein [Acetobacteraceae bacterium]
MLADRYELSLSTASAVARDAYVQGCNLALTFYPGAVNAFDGAIAADPAFALAHAGKAQVLMREGNVAAARAALAAAKDAGAGLSAREASHIAYFDLVFAGRTDDAIAALQAHLAAWPRDALVLATAANPNGLIGASGRIGQKHQIAVMMDSLAPHYGDDWWFLAHHAMALSEDGQIAAARPKIEQSVAANPNNAHGAHGFAHVCYESGERDTARAWLSSWLATYPRDGFFHGHLSWHLSLCELQAGNWAEALRLYRDAMVLDRHSGGPQQRMSDGAAFLWRSELAGYPRDTAAWRALYEYANSALPRPGAGLADLHVILAQAVVGDAAGLDVRARQMEDLATQGRYPSGAYLPALSRGFTAFERGDFSAAIEALTPLAAETERIGGSRAQHDLIEFTLLRACLEAGRLEEARRLLGARRPGASGIAVEGVAALH